MYRSVPIYKLIFFVIFVVIVFFKLYFVILVNLNFVNGKISIPQYNRFS